MSTKRNVILIFLFLGIFTVYGCSEKVVTKESLANLKECYGNPNFESDSELVARNGSADCEKLKKNIAGLSQRGLEAYSYPFLYFLMLVLVGGVIGGAMNGITGPGRPDKKKSTKNSKADSKAAVLVDSVDTHKATSNSSDDTGLGMGKTIFIGIGASIVGVTFLGSFVHLKYEMIAPLESGNVVSVPDFIETSITIMGLAIISGFLGVRLVQKVADGLLNEKLDKIERRSSDNLREIIDSFNERTMDLDNMAKFRELIHNGWYSILKGCDLIEAGAGQKHESDRYIREGVGTLQEAIVLDGKSAKAYTWLAYGYKRLVQTQQALDTITTAIDLEPTAKRYYNAACYQSLLQRPIEEILDSLRMVDSLVDEKDVIAFDGFLDGILKSDPDLDSIRDKVEFKDFISSSKFKIR